MLTQFLWKFRGPTMRYGKRDFVSLMILACTIVRASVIYADDAAPPSSINQVVNDFTLQDHLGAKRSLKEWSDQRVIVIVFLGTECPLVKLYAPKLVRLSETYAT